MKKILMTILLIASATLAYSQVSYKYPVEIGVGYSRPQLRDWSHKGVTTPEATFNMIECYFFGAYAGLSIPTEVSYADGTTGITNFYRVGFELGRFSFGYNWWVQSLAITPFYSFGKGFADGNKNAWGLKLDYSFSILDVSFIASKQELTFGIAIIFPYYANKRMF